MKKGVWNELDISFLKKYYGIKTAKEISEHIGRDVKSVRNKADLEGLMSRNKTQRVRNENLALDMLRKGARCKYKISKVTTLDLTVVSAIITKFLNESVLSHKPKYFETEQDIFDSMDLKYEPKDLQGWELEQFKKIN